MNGLTNDIRKLRFNNNEMTQRQLAERVGVSRQTMNAIENGHHAPRIDVAIRIADVFRVTVDELFEYRYDGEPEAASIAAERTVAADRPVQRRPAEDMSLHVSAEVEGGDAPDAKAIDQVSLVMLRRLVK